jgi:hypothetical protein
MLYLQHHESERKDSRQRASAINAKGPKGRLAYMEDSRGYRGHHDERARRAPHTGVRGAC